MSGDLELFQFISDRVKGGEHLMLLVVAESSGSSPGRRGYKMAIAADGELFGSIGGGVMEVNLVELSREMLRTQTPSPASPQAGESDAGNHPTSFLKPQVHQKNSPDSSGMICSGRQTLIFKLLTPRDRDAIDTIADSLRTGRRDILSIGPDTFTVAPAKGVTETGLRKNSDTDLLYTERIGAESDLYIVGGGHCALALSELASRLDFHIRLFDDRPNLNTIEKNRFANEIIVINTYEQIAEHIPSDPEAYVVVMTLGYRTDETVIRRLIEKDFKYFGVLGSEAKMATLLRNLRDEGFPADRLASIRTPIGLPINSHTPEEIAVSIAAEMISVRNS